MAIRGALLLCLLLSFKTSEVQAKSYHQLRIATFNLRWFGSEQHDSNYSLPSSTAERISAVKNFLKRELKPLDIIAFQEIVDLRSLKKILPPLWKCKSYKHLNPMHQSVAVCASPKFKLLTVLHDDDDIINEVASYDAQRARPAVRVDVADASGARILRIVAVHLKSAPHMARLRLKQAGIIGRDLKADQEIPTVVLGDFNTYSKEDTGLEADDFGLIKSQLDQSQKSFRHLKLNKPITFRNKRYKSQFDRIYASSNVKASGAEVFPICSELKNPDYADYLRYISDHCPVIALLQIPKNP